MARQSYHISLLGTQQWFLCYNYQVLQYFLNYIIKLLSCFNVLHINHWNDSCWHKIKLQYLILSFISLMTKPVRIYFLTLFDNTFWALLCSTSDTNNFILLGFKYKQRYQKLFVLIKLSLILRERLKHSC